MTSFPRVLYDHQVFSEQRYGGVSRYFLELITRLPVLGVETSLALKFSNNSYLAASPIGKDFFYLGDWNFRGKNRLMHFFNERVSRARLSAGDYDIFHPTYFNPYFIEQVGKKPFVLTIYDMIHELYPENFKAERERRMADFKRTLAERADRIITISETTRNDVIKLYSASPDKVIPIHLASSLSPERATPPENFGLKPGYLLFVGERYGYKNFSGMCRALAPLLAGQKVSLVCAGGGAFTPGESAMFSALGIRDVFRYPAGDRQLAWLYANAAGLVLPSLYEGFGIPVLEAFSCGCPAALARAGSLPEVGGEAALYFDPSDDASMLEAARQLLAGGSLREELKRKGRERLRAFSWEATAEKTLEVYKGLL